MNLCDNGVDQVLSDIRRIVTEDELCFAIDIVDYYGKKMTVKKMTLKEIQRVQEKQYFWVE